MMQTIIVLAAISYDSMKQRPQHLAEDLAQRGKIVIFVDLKSRYHYVDDNIENAVEKNIKSLKQVGDNLYVLDQTLFVTKDEKSVISRLIAKLGGYFCSTNCMYLVTFPEWVDYLDDISTESLLVYDCLDDWEEFAQDLDVGLKEILIYKERKLFCISDYVTATAKRLYTKASYYNNNVHYFPNGVKVDDFRQTVIEIPKDLKNIPGPIVFFMGAIAGWVSQELIAYIAQMRPNYSFVFVGPSWTTKERLPKSNNLYFLGEKKYYELVNYLNQSDVAIIPFKENELTASVTPLKFFEYISAGVPVVSTMLPDLLGIPGAFIANSYSEFVEKIDYCLEMQKNKKSLRSEIIEASHKFAWEKLIDDWMAYDRDRNYSKDTESFIKDSLELYRAAGNHWMILNERMIMCNRLNLYKETIEIGEYLVQNDLQVKWNELALAYFKCGLKEKAVICLQKLIQPQARKKYELNFDYINKYLLCKKEEYYLEAFLLKICNKHSEAITLLDRYYGQEPDNLFLKGMLASLYAELGEFSIALDVAIQTIEAAPHRITENIESYLLILLIDYLIEQGQYKLAEDLAFLLGKYKLDDLMAEKLGAVYLNTYAPEKI
jgi:glycosyltransferase involved in cell wall biosynthesis